MPADGSDGRKAVNRPGAGVKGTPAWAAARDRYMRHLKKLLRLFGA